MPAKGKTKVTPRQRNLIAQGRLAGKTSSQVAQETGLKAQTVRTHTHDTRTVTQILTLRQQSEAEFGQMWRQMVLGVAKDMQAKSFDQRHASRQTFLKMLTAGDPPLQRVGDVGSMAGDFTLEEMLLVMRKVTVSA